ncbi:MAG: ATP-binding protein [Endomicrobia bacterium]|nr:ATP-binding protein [Endomicrobiia bacterium]MCL2507063.1 ATP-binding protein [Endomicrobiia bacterium]
MEAKRNIYSKTLKEEQNDEKLVVLNKFASIASHDLKNPLASLKNIAYYFKNAVKIDGEIPNKMLKMLSSEVDRMDKMIVELLDSTRVKQLKPVISDLYVLINEAVEKEKSESVNFKLNLTNYKVNVDPEKFKHVICSLIKNSKEAMSSGGDISINMSKDGDYVIIEITDIGKGMDADTLGKCFDPMFSTKTAKALGMSLTVSKQIIDMSGGSIKAESCLGKGAKFTITLPLVI